MSIKESIKKFWNFLKQDTLQSWIVSLVLIIILIKFIFFPVLSFITQSPLPLVVIESCSMYHESNFEDWWSKNANWYESNGISKEEFSEFSFKNGLNKGDIIFVWGRSDYKIGDVIIFSAPTKHPIIHRLVLSNPLATKGDHNNGQLPIETDISPNAVFGKASARIPLLGWVKLIFFEPFSPSNQRGFCR